MPRHWTIMVYLAGDNDLESFGERDLLEMKMVGSTPAVQVVAQFDRMSDGVTRRYALTSGTDLAADIAAELPESNTGDPASLLEFVRWGLDTFPADHSALVLWNHGAGWKDDDVYAGETGETRDTRERSDSPRSLIRGAGRRPLSRSLFRSSIRRALRYPAPVRAILFDDTSKDFLDNQELKVVLDGILHGRGARKLDLLGFDACLMNMVEVAAQVRHACTYMVGSQEVEPGEGWNYAAVLAALNTAPDASPSALARTIVDTYVAEHAPGAEDFPVTQSALSLEHVPPLLEAISSLADHLVARLQDPAFYSRVLFPVLREVQKFRDEQYVDLCHFCQLLAARATDDELRAIAGRIAARLDPAAPDSLVCAVDRRGAGVAAAQGVSIYLPFLGVVSPAYAELEFTRACSWGTFLHAFVET